MDFGTWLAFFAASRTSSGSACSSGARRPSRSPRRRLRASRRVALVLRGWIVNALNPKGTLFMLAVLPQFLDLGAALAPQYVVMGATLAFTDLVVMGGYTALASKVLRLLRSPRQVRAMNRGFGALFIAAGALLATFRRG